ncbi:MAG: response regulator [Desulfobulbaceae bacterium]|nr:response regulator [Desulfobulbaceae bacterium]HIJ89910.1 response regulator [Deltaproteobacteria bacterium]
MRISIFKKIFLSQLALIIFASGGISLVSYFFMVRLYNESQNDTLRILSSSTAAKVATKIAQQKATLKEIAEAREVAQYAENYQEPLLDRHLLRYQGKFPVLSYVDKDGNQDFSMVNGHVVESSDNLAGMEVFRASLAAPNQAILGEVVFDQVLQTQTLVFAYSRIEYFGDQFLGQILGKTPLAQIVAPAEHCISQDKGYCRVVAPDGKILGDPEQKNIMKQLVIKDQPIGRLFAKDAAEPHGRIYHDTVNGQDCYYAVAMIPDTPWLVMSVLPAYQYDAVPRLFMDFSILLFLVLLLLASISTFFLAQGIIAPIQKLVLATIAMGKGDFEQRVAVGNDEIGDLAESFNTMAEKLGNAMNREKQILAAEASARLNAELADQYKSEFLSKISHELRTPLNNVLGMAELLEDGEGSGNQRAEIAAIKEAGQNLLQIVEGILDFSRLENGTMSLTPVPFDLYASLGRLKKKYEPAAEAKGITLSYEESSAVPTTVVGDQIRITQILENLLDNAIKFTEHGEVSLRVRPLGIKASNNQHIIHLRFEIADTGFGIPLEQQTAMFESFKQFESYTTRKKGGLGIGLTLSHQLVDLMGGKIGMKSEPGKGSTFFVDLDLPVAKEEDAEAPGVSGTQAAADTADAESEQHPISNKGMNILIAEDNPVNQMLLRLMLEMQGHHVQVTVDGKEAVAIYQSEKIDLIMMDVQMPGMNGFEATTIIRELEKCTGRHVPIIAVTAHVMPGYREECLSVGMDNYLAKPFRMQELFGIIEETLAQCNRLPETKKRGSISEI